MFCCFVSYFLMQKPRKNISMRSKSCGLLLGRAGADQRLLVLHKYLLFQCSCAVLEKFMCLCAMHVKNTSSHLLSVGSEAATSLLANTVCNWCSIQLQVGAVRALA